MIIEFTKDAPPKSVFTNLYPDQFVTEKEKQDPDWVKNTVDYFANVAYAQYIKNRDTFVKNYGLVKGILGPEDYYQEEEVRSFSEQILGNNSLPAYVKHYSILNPPLNTMVGEATKRPDMWKSKAFDDESKNEELEFKTDIYQKYVTDMIHQSVMMSMSQQGVDLSTEEGQQQFQETAATKLKEYLTDYTSMAERWANHTLEASKVMFNMKEKSEEGMRDLLISAREFFHIYEDTSKVGFNVEVANPKNVWKLASPDKKYSKDWYAGGLVEIMELSEVIEKIPDLTKEEIDHLRKGYENAGNINGREPAWARGITGNNSIEYDTYDPLVLHEMQALEAEMLRSDSGDTSIGELMGHNTPVSAFGNKFIVLTAYFQSKKLIKLVHYLDEDGQPQSMLTDETYVDGSHPTEIGIEEGWTNIWYQARKIGPEVYHCKPLTIVDYCPIIGVVHEIKNTEAKSLVDLMKPFQILYNVCMNQLFKLLEKEVGKVFLTSIRHIPIPKDGDAQDALEIWEEEARARGVVFLDDSPENLKGPSSFNQHSAVDLSRTQEIQSRYNLAAQLKNECWQLVGISQQRLGGSTGATETATQTQTGLQQSYTQTEPYFVQHEYVMGQVFQAIVDAAQYIESQKEKSTLSYISSAGESAFIEVNGNDLKMRDLKVFLTNRPEDTRMFNEIRGLSQAMLQNGATPYEIIQLYSTNSIRQMKKVFKDLKEKMDAFQQQEQQLKQQQLEAQQQQVAAQLEATAQEAEANRANDNMNKDLDRINKKEVAVINALSRNENATADNDGNGVADALEITRMAQEESRIHKEHDLKMGELSRKEKERQDKLFIELEKMKLEKEKILAQKEIEKMKLRNPVAGEKVKKPAKKK